MSPSLNFFFMSYDIDPGPTPVFVDHLELYFDLIHNFGRHLVFAILDSNIFVQEKRWGCDPSCRTPFLR